MIARTSTTLAICFLIALGAACTPPLPDAPEVFLEAFVAALESGDQGQWQRFYVGEGDFDVAAPGGAQAAEHFRSAVRGKFLRSCAGAFGEMRGRQVTVLGVDLSGGAAEQPDLPTRNAAQFLKGVQKRYTNAAIRLRVGDESLTLVVDELVRIGGGWRIIGLRTIHELGTERLPERTIQPSTESTGDAEEPPGN